MARLGPPVVVSVVVPSAFLAVIPVVSAARLDGIHLRVVPIPVDADRADSPRSFRDLVLFHDGVGLLGEPLIVRGVGIGKDGSDIGGQGIERRVARSQVSTLFPCKLRICMRKSVGLRSPKDPFLVRAMSSAWRRVVLRP